VRLEWKDPTTLRVRLVVVGAIPDLTTNADRVVTLGGRMSVGHDGKRPLCEVDLPIEVPLEL
jgi:hypothetical protein